jgi:hypothetical protein
MKFKLKNMFLILLVQSLIAENSNKMSMFMQNQTPNNSQMQNNNIPNQFQYQNYMNNFQNPSQITSNNMNINEFQNANRKLNKDQEEGQTEAQDEEQQENDGEEDNNNQEKNNNNNQKNETTITTSHSSILPQLGMGAGIPINPMANPLYNPFSPLNPMNYLANNQSGPAHSEENKKKKIKIVNPLKLPELEVPENCDSVKKQAVLIVNEVLSNQHKMIWENVTKYLLKSKFLVGMTEVKLTRNLRKKLYGIMKLFGDVNYKDITFKSKDHSDEGAESDEIDDFLDHVVDEQDIDQDQPKVDDFVNKI